MFIAGVNFVMSYFALPGKFKKILKTKNFVFIVYDWDCYPSGYASTLVECRLCNKVAFNHPQVFGKVEGSFRHALFQTLAVITTTGFVTADFTAWTPFLTIVFFGLMFMGGSAGSTSGGVKGTSLFDDKKWIFGV